MLLMDNFLCNFEKPLTVTMTLGLGIGKSIISWWFADDGNEFNLLSGDYFNGLSSSGVTRRRPI